MAEAYNIATKNAAKSADNKRVHGPSLRVGSRVLKKMLLRREDQAKSGPIRKTISV